MKVFAIADHHFFHKNIIEYSYPYRPFDTLEEMHDYSIQQWNNVVSNEDLVIYCGDFGFGNKEILTEILSKLNGQKILIKGNHDNHSNSFFLDCGFRSVHKKLCCGNVLFTHKPYTKALHGRLNIHGHIHNNSSQYDNSSDYWNVSVEMHNFEPVELTEFKLGECC